LAGRKVFQEFSPDVGEEGLFVDTVFGVEAVVGCPVLVLAAADADEVGEGAATLV
jgi:hypothetical protein